jgi:hypothetical protein
MKRKAVTWSIAMALGVGAVPWTWAENSPVVMNASNCVTLEIQSAAPIDIAQRLGEALGGEVRFDGALPEAMSLTVTELPATTVLDQVAAAVKGKWERIYRLSRTDAPLQTHPLQTGSKLTLRLEKIPCATAASIVARMAGAKIEADGEIEGDVTLSGVDLPVEEALDTIAKAAGMVWRPVYVVHGSYAAPTSPVAAKTPGAAASPSGATPDSAGQPSSPSKRAKKTEKKRPARTKYNQIQSLGAKAPDPITPMDLKKAEELANLGQFAAIFAQENKGDREQLIKRYRAGLETSARRLDNFEPRYRLAAMRMVIVHLQQITTDYTALNEEQKKEVAPIMEFVNARIKEAETLLGRQK